MNTISPNYMLKSKVISSISMFRQILLLDDEGADKADEGRPLPMFAPIQKGKEYR